MTLQTSTRWLWGAAVLACTAAVAVLASGERGAPGSLLPHGYCFTWNPILLWTHVASDSLIGAAYVSIPLTLVHLVRRRTDLPFNWIVVLFALFIISCGATHWIEVWTVWHPDYWLSGNVKLVTAAASVLTAGALIRLVPKILAIPTVSQLREAKMQLEAEVATRRQAEGDLLRERSELERRVFQRTEELAQAVQDAKAAHAMAEEASRLKDQFLAKVSHELRTPLQAILVCAEILQRTGLDPARSAQAAQRLQHNVRSQARLIDDLLDISRILSGKLELHMQQADALQAIGHAVEVVNSAARARGISIERGSDRDHSVLMQTDPVRLEQVIWNLLNNAVQASSSGGRVLLSCHSDGANLHVEVRDWGKGIEPSDLAHVFEPFRQGPQGANAHRGLGLGLAITRNIVELFGGNLKVQSQGIGHGATFSLQLPLGDIQSVTPPASSAELDEAEARQISGMRLLYVEDDPDIAEGVRTMLTELGAQVEMCLEFETAAARVATGGFDVLLSDLNLGDGHTALELIGILRGSPAQHHVPAIVLSAYGGISDRSASLAAGFDAHLVKPVVASDIARALINAARPVD